MEGREVGAPSAHAHSLTFTWEQLRYWLGVFGEGVQNWVLAPAGEKAVWL